MPADRIHQRLGKELGDSRLFPPRPPLPFVTNFRFWGLLVSRIFFYEPLLLPFFTPISTAWRLENPGE